MALWYFLADIIAVIISLCLLYSNSATPHRLPDSGAVRILPVGKWSTSTLRPKFIIVELQLLLQIMKCDEQMHRNYATMRDKMTN
jgi:hypothetical protein